MPVKLGELLLEEKLITPQQLEDALEHQKANGGQLGKAFVALGFLRDEDIRRLLSRQYGFPSLALDHLQVDPKVVDIIPAVTARKYKVLPLSLLEKTLRLGMADPINVLAIDDIRFMTGYRIEPAAVSPLALDEALDRYYGPLGKSIELRPGTQSRQEAQASPRAPDELPLTPDDMASIGGLSEIDLDSMGDAEADVEPVRSDDDEIELTKSADAAPVIKLTNVLLVDSVKRGASDIHIEPYEKEFRVRFRINGVLYNVMALPMRLRDPLISRVKLMAKLDIGEKRLPQDGLFKVKFKVEDRSRDVDFRVSVRPTLWGEKIVLRLLDKSRLVLDMTKLGFEPYSLERFKNAISKPYGIVLVTGPTGSGKTNTLYSAIAALNRPDTNIMTAEDSVDFTLPGINQVQINENIGESFASVLRSLLRQDANIIMVSEIRDYETAEIAVRAALGGHLLLSTLHTNDALSTVSRLVSLGIDPFLVGSAVNLVLAQRLVRRVCAKCTFDDTASLPPRALLGVGFAPDVIGSFQVMRGKGCAICNGTGYRGRVGLFEVMEITEGIRERIAARATAVEIRKKALEEGMITLRMSGLEKISQGITTIEEVLRETVA